MSPLRSLATGVLVLLSLAACSHDATAPTRPDGAGPAGSSSGTLNITWLRAPGQIGVNQSCVWQVMTSGGRGPYTYTWTPYGLVEDYATSEYFGGHGPSTGSFSLTLTVTDADGRTGSRSVSGVVTFDYNFSCDW
jgi:hypothetical protein